MKALVIGGTGPSGPYIVNGLLERGYRVVVLHGGQHEIESDSVVEHIHADPHFSHTLERGLGARTFDLTIATYGRVGIIAQVMSARTERLITISGGLYAAPGDPRWGGLGAHLLIGEDSPMQTEPCRESSLNYLVWQTEQIVMRHHAEGHYNATIFRYPSIHGPRAIADSDWCVLRRVLDKRPYLIVGGDGGYTLRSRADGQNAAHAVLLGVDKPREAGGQVYNVAEDRIYTVRQRVELIARFMKHEWELVEIPTDVARRVCPRLIRRAHHVLDTTKIRTELGYRDQISPEVALVRSVEWLLSHRPEPGGEFERQLGDPFNYAAEDDLVKMYKNCGESAAAVHCPEIRIGHKYRHPSRPDEEWTPVVFGIQ